MKLRTGILGALCIALAQRPAPVTVIGTVERVGGSGIQVNSGAHPVIIQSGSGTEVWKSGERRTLAALQAGDEISARCERDASGKLVAAVVRAGTVRFSGVLTKVGPASFEVTANPNERKSRVVRFYPATVFSTSARDLAAGHTVEVVALDAGDGAFDAARVTFYNTDLQVE